MTVEQEINVFFGWIADQRQQIDELPEPFRRILLLALLDTLANLAFPKAKNDSRRFVKLVDAYSGWDYKDRVSLPQLRYLLAVKTAPDECFELKAEVERRLSHWIDGEILRPEAADPLRQEMDRFHNPLCKKLIARARYASLLWVMRNFAVHEFRAPGRGRAISTDNSTPYYYKYLELPSQRSTWELYIPSEVISGLVSTCANGLKQHFAHKRINPYGRSHFESTWFSNAL